MLSHAKHDHSKCNYGRGDDNRKVRIRDPRQEVERHLTEAMPLGDGSGGLEISRRIRVQVLSGNFSGSAAPELRWHHGKFQDPEVLLDVSSTPGWPLTSTGCREA